jgi:ABC-2 type transport system ATP-binding protein
MINDNSVASTRPPACNVSLDVPTGSAFALFGPNGAGKTTAVKILMNLVEPTSGHAGVLGVKTTRLGPAERVQIGYVSENRQLPVWMRTEYFLSYCKGFIPTGTTAKPPN